MRRATIVTIHRAAAPAPPLVPCVIQISATPSTSLLDLLKSSSEAAAVPECHQCMTPCRQTVYTRELYKNLQAIVQTSCKYTSLFPATDSTISKCANCDHHQS